MEGPDIQGPQVWLDLNRKAEAKILDYHKANLERLKWLDQYVEECKLKLGVQVSEEPSFVPKTPGKSKGKPKRGGRRTTRTDNDDTVVVEETNRRGTRAKANITVTEEPSQRTAKAKKSADSEDDPDIQEAIRRSKLEQPPVPSPRASKRTRNVPDSKSSASSNAASGDEAIPEIDDEPTVKKATGESQVIPPSEVVNSTIIISNEEPEKNAPEDNVFIEAEVVSKPSAVDAVRNILSSVEVSMPSPIAAPRRSFRNFSEADEGDKLVSKKQSLIPVEVEAVSEPMEEEATESQDDQEVMELGNPDPSDNEENIEIDQANVTKTVEKPSNISSSDKTRNISKSSSKSKSRSSVSDEEAFVSMDNSSEKTRTLPKSQSSVSDTDVSPSHEKVSSSEKTVTQNKDITIEDEADSRPKRSSRTKVIDASLNDSSKRTTRTKAKVASSADDKSDKEEETSRRTTRTKVIPSKANTSTESGDQEEEAPRRATRTKIKDAPRIDTNDEEETSRRTTRSKVSKLEADKEKPSRRATRTKAAQSETESESEESHAGKRNTRSKIANKTSSPEVASKPTRSTRTLTKKMASSSTLTKPSASPRVRELASRALSPTKSATPNKNIAVGYTGSPIRDRVKVFENAMKESAGLKSSSSEEETETIPPKTPLRQFFTPKRRSSIANSLRKVSAARNMSVAKVVEEQEVNMVSPPSKKGPVIRKSPGTKPAKVNLNNSRAPTGKIIKSGVNKKVAASGGRGVTPGSGSSTGSSSLVRSRSRMAIIDKAGKTTPSGNGPTNLRVGATSFLQQKPKGPTLEEIQEKKDEERRKKEQREVEARQRREEMLKKKAEESKRARDEKIKRVAEARQQQQHKKEKEKEQKLEKERERENQEKLEVLKKKAEMHKEAAKRKKEAEDKLLKEEEERETMLEEERRREQIRKEEEMRMEKKKQELRKQEELRRVAQAKEKERILREQQEMKRVRDEAERRAADTENLNSTYNKPADATFNRTVDQSHVGPSSYDITPARHELPPKPPMTEEDYGLEDLNSGTDTDDEDNPKKKVPKWAEGTALRTALLKQCYMGPDVDKIFYTITDPDLSVLFGQQHKRYNKRTSSACWDTAPASFNFSKRC